MPQVIRQFTEARTIAAELPMWDAAALGPGALTPMQTRAWIVACAETFHSHGDLRIIVLEDEAGIAGVAPLIRRRQFPGRTELLGVRELSEPSDFVYRDQASLTRLLREVVRTGRPLALDRIPARSDSIPALRRGYRGRGAVVARPGNNCPHIPLPGRSGTVDDLLSSRLRSDLRRAQRKAEAHGAVSWEIHAPRTPDQFEPLYEQALRIEAAGWKGQGGSAVAVNEIPRAFFRRYGGLASHDGTLRLAFLRLGGTVAAMQYAVQWNGAFWLLKVGYDETFAKCSPGQLLMHHTLRYAVGQGLRSYEFLGTAETWTQRWTESESATAQVRVYPAAVTGLCSLSQDLLTWGRRRLGSRLNALWQRPASEPVAQMATGTTSPTPA